MDTFVDHGQTVFLVQRAEYLELPENWCSTVSGLLQTRVLWTHASYNRHFSLFVFLEDQEVIRF